MSTTPRALADWALKSGREMVTSSFSALPDVGPKDGLALWKRPNFRFLQVDNPALSYLVTGFNLTGVPAEADGLFHFIIGNKIYCEADVAAFPGWLAISPNDLILTPDGRPEFYGRVSSFGDWRRTKLHLRCTVFRPI